MVMQSSGPESNDDGASSKMNPTVIQETDHPIRKQDIDREALKVLYRLRDAGFSGYLVGGGVRDLYLGKKPKDFDISTDAKPGQLRKIFRNSRTIGRRFRLVQVFFHGGKIIEVSTLRSHSEHDINADVEVLPANNSFGTLDEDAFRRDLTINSLFFEVENSTIIDFVNGVKDLDDGIVRIVGDPDSRVTRDPVRIMRAVRHAARNDFRIDERSWKAIVQNRHKLDLCPTSRIRDEFLKDARSGSSLPWLQLAFSCGLFTTLFPLYGKMLDGEQGDLVRKELKGIFRLLDRFHLDENKDKNISMPDHLLFTLVLFPWAIRHFDLTPGKLTGAAYHQLSGKIRDDLEILFARRFNAKRCVKESMASLLVNYPAFQLHHSEDNIPKWLKKKSYYQECSRFLSLINESKGGEEAELKDFVEEPVIQQVDVLTEIIHTNGSAKGRKNVMPAFSSAREGVFGLRNVERE